MIGYAVDKLSRITGCAYCRFAELFPDQRIEASLIMFIDRNIVDILHHISGQEEKPGIRELLEKLPEELTIDLLIQEHESLWRLSQSTYGVLDTNSIFWDLMNFTYQKPTQSNQDIPILKVEYAQPNSYRSYCDHLTLDHEVKAGIFDLDFVRELTNDLSIDPGTINYRHSILMATAIFTGKIDVIDYLIDELNFDINKQFPFVKAKEGTLEKDQASCIGYAVDKSQTSLFHLLNKDCQNLHIALILSMEFDQDETTSLLMENYDITTISVDNQYLILVTALKCEKYNILEKFMSLGLDLTDEIVSLIQIKNMEMVRYLMRFNIDVGIIYKAAAKSACKNNDELFEFVTKADYFDSENSIECLSDALDSNNDFIIKFLFSKGIDINKHREKIRNVISRISCPSRRSYEILAECGVDFTDKDMSETLLKSIYPYIVADDVVKAQRSIDAALFLFDRCPDLINGSAFMIFIKNINQDYLIEILSKLPKIDFNQECFYRELAPHCYIFGITNPNQKISLLRLVLERHSKYIREILDPFYDQGGELHESELKSFFNFHFQMMCNKFWYQNVTKVLDYFKSRGFEYNHQAMPKLVIIYAEN